MRSYWMRKFSIITCLSLVVAPCLTAKAQDVVGAPSRTAPSDVTRSGDGLIFTTPGLWEITATVDDEAVPGTSRACVDLELQKKHDVFAQVAPANAGCEKPRRTPVAGGFNYEAVCKVEGATSRVAGELRGDARHVMIRAKVNVAVGGATIPPVRYVLESRWVGACPSGMKPGDVDEDGQRRNMLQD